MVGAVDEPPGKTGLAHLVEHLMFTRRAGPV
jgi:predicted Zn-dependent peptidase